MTSVVRHEDRPHPAEVIRVGLDVYARGPFTGEWRRYDATSCRLVPVPAGELPPECSALDDDAARYWPHRFTRRGRV